MQKAFWDTPGDSNHGLRRRSGGELPYSTAVLYKSIYECFEGNPKLVHRLPLSLLMIVKENGFPDEIKRLIAESPEAFEQADVNSFKEALQAFQGWED